MKQKEVKFKKGSIVVVKEGVAYGNEPNTITKVLSKPNRYPDHLAMLYNDFYSKTHLNIVLCKASEPNKFNQTCNNTPCFVENINDLRPASLSEKILFKQNGYKPLISPEIDEDQLMNEDLI